MTIGERIKTIRLQKSMTQEDLAKHISSTKQAIYKYETGIVTNIPLNRLEQIADALGVTAAYLMGWDDGTVSASNLTPFRRAKRQIPLVGDIACGTPILAEQNITRLVDLPDGIDADYCLTCHGDSMIGARIYDGDIVYIRQQAEVDNGQIAAVLIGDEATLKRVYYYPEKQKLMLQAENTAFEPLMYIGDELSEIRIIGLAIAFTSLVR